MIYTDYPDERNIAAHVGSVWIASVDTVDTEPHTSGYNWNI